ncbi:hypothetical protein F2Q68_00027575 [Brassica cretica]|uniref:Uncharacterized protein n=1 Tax=Brassica cretica TaxID=69181 RepID=A0A8S9I796_BRACR|nr:hypothetical protein F2Q68_00027575 [Brassica cretica]
MDFVTTTLTPLFRHLELDISVYQCSETTAFIDIPYLINCQILRDENTCSFLISLRRPKLSYRDDTMDDVEFVCTDGGNNEYDLGPLDDNADAATYQRWMVDSQRKNNSLMKRILKVITGGCMGAPSTAEPVKTSLHHAVIVQGRS